MSSSLKLWLLIAAAALSTFGAKLSAQPVLTAGSAERTTRLSLIVKDAPSANAPLRWALYVSKETLPGLLSRGQPFRKGVLEHFGRSARIDVGEVPAGTYFAIVAQDIDGDQKIASLREPRGYSGYDGCLIPDWDRGAREVSGPAAYIAVLLRCNNDVDPSRSEQARAG
jgi:uncharacterized protein (DUF2141 family)